MTEVIFPEIDLTGIKGALIDLDNTLYAYEPCHQAALQACFKEYNGELSYLKFSALYRDCRNAVMKRCSPLGNCRSRLFAFRILCEKLYGPYSYIKALQLAECYWDNFIQKMELARSARSFLISCDRYNVPVCLVSDMSTDIQIRKIQKLQVANLINFLITSEEVGIEKPDKRMFDAALNQLELNYPEVIMIGDDEAKDIQGARQVGIQAYKVQVI